METDYATVLADRPDLHAADRAGILCRCGMACGWKASIFNFGDHITVTCFKDDGKKIRLKISNTHEIGIETTGYGSDVSEKAASGKGMEKSAQAETDPFQAEKDVRAILDLASQSKGIVYDSDQKNLLNSTSVK